MIRTAQMMIAEGFVRHRLGDNWKHTQKPFDNPETRVKLQEIITLFGDSPKFPLSLHNIVDVGSRKYDKKPGEWFGPATVSNTIRDIFNTHQDELDIMMYTAGDGLIDVKEITTLFKSKQSKLNPKAEDAASAAAAATATSNGKGKSDNSEEVEWKPLIILVPVKVGMETVHPTYIPSLESIFMIPQNIGVVGGKPYSSFYFIAGQGEVLHFLDPHYVQEFVPIPPDLESYEIRTWTDPEIRWIKATNVDATFSIGFFIRDKMDFVRFEMLSKLLFSKVSALYSFENGLVSKESLLKASSTVSQTNSSSGENTAHRKGEPVSGHVHKKMDKEEKEEEESDGEIEMMMPIKKQQQQPLQTLQTASNQEPEKTILQASISPLPSPSPLEPPKKETTTAAIVPEKEDGDDDDDNTDSDFEVIM